LRPRTAGLLRFAHGREVYGGQRDLYDCTAGDFSVDVGLECAGKLVERDRAMRDAREVSRAQIGRDASPYFVPFRACVAEELMP
jgi:hypothetical protein